MPRSYTNKETPANIVGASEAFSEVSELFSEQGIIVDTNVNKDLFSGISTVKRYLKVVGGRAKLYIFRNCVNLIREMKNYRWGKEDAPVKYDDHALDELRYYLMTKPENIPVKPAKTLVQLNKERLYRKILNERRRL